MEVLDLDPSLSAFSKWGGPDGGPGPPDLHTDLEGLDPHPDPPILRMQTRRGPGPGPPWKPALKGTEPSSNKVPNVRFWMTERSGQTNDSNSFVSHSLQRTMCEI